MKYIAAALLIAVFVTACTLNVGSFGTIEEDKTHGVELNTGE